VTDAVLQIEGLTAGYDQAAVIRGLEMTVGPGEVVALLGANGAGKTTTLRVVSGLVHQMSGRVAFAGRDLADVSPTQRVRLGIRPRQVERQRLPHPRHDRCSACIAASLVGRRDRLRRFVLPQLPSSPPLKKRRLMFTTPMFSCAACCTVQSMLQTAADSDPFPPVSSHWPRRPARSARHRRPPRLILRGDGAGHGGGSVARGRPGPERCG